MTGIHEHLDLDITETHLGRVHLTICRSCLSEHAPLALEVIELEADQE